MWGKVKSAILVCLISAGAAFAADTNSNQPVKVDVVTISTQVQHNEIKPGSESAIAVNFNLEKRWHFYASEKMAPGGMNLKITPSAQKFITFSKPIFPQSQVIVDKAVGKLDVYSDKFTVFLPFTISKDTLGGKTVVSIAIDGAVCSEEQCRMPKFPKLQAEVVISANAAMEKSNFSLPVAAAEEKKATVVSTGEYPVSIALLLALAAGLLLNVMPCVWPVLPIIVMRLVKQAQENKAKSIAMGLAFCCGIMLFFACLAGINIILQVFYHTVLQWGDQFRNPVFLMVMSLFLVLMALFMFGVFAIQVPTSISGKAGAGKGIAGAVGMGFLAAILSTPCSFAILAAAFAWAQSQPLLPATLAIMTIGVGMAMPYALLTSMPTLLKKIPKPGKWMDILKQAVGFVLVLIAVWLIAALPAAQKMSVVYFAVILSFAAWMWGWVDINSKLTSKVIVRSIAIIIAVMAGWLFLSSPVKLINWQSYDESVIEKAIAENRPVLIDFTADWCVSCLVVDKTVYSRSDIAELIKQKKVLAVKADTTTKDSPATIALKDKYNEPGVPVSMLFLPNKKEPTRWRGKTFGDELKKLLQEVDLH